MPSARPAAASTPAALPASGLRILIAEDDPLLGHHLETQLAARGYQPRWCTNLDDTRRELTHCPCAVLLLDVLLPGGNGLDLLRDLRRTSGVPVILTSALGSEGDRIQGFRSGADDHLPKPFGFDELQVRIEALCRRIAFERLATDLLTPAAAGDELAFDPLRQDVRHRGLGLGLTASEYRVLEALWRQPGEVMSKPLLYRQALQRACSRYDRSLDMHVSHLRRKLQQAGCLDVEIRTVWGQGYALVRSSV